MIDFDRDAVMYPNFLMIFHKLYSFVKPEIIHILNHFYVFANLSVISFSIE